MDGGDAASGKAIDDGEVRPFDILDDDTGHGTAPSPKMDSDMDIFAAMLKSELAQGH
jgi:hypothetical protein